MCLTKQCLKCGEIKPLDLFESVTTVVNQVQDVKRVNISEQFYRKNKIAIQFESRVNTLKSVL